MKIGLILFLLFPVLLFGQAKRSMRFDPTGTYQLKGKTEERDGETYGYFGDIRVKLLSDSRIVITLFVCKGAPSYNAGTLWDTLIVKGNVAVYLPEDDSTCRITFTFKRQKIIVSQVQADLNFGCGFGHGVFAFGEWLKISDEIPLIQDPASGSENLLIQDPRHLAAFSRAFVETADAVMGEGMGVAEGDGPP